MRFVSQIRSGYRPRRKAPLWAIAVTVLAVIGFDQVGRSVQTAQAISGTVRRVYEDRPWYRIGSRHHGTGHCYFEVIGSDGAKHDVRVYSRQLWRDTLPGDFVNKVAGELDPHVIRNH